MVNGAGKKFVLFVLWGYLGLISCAGQVVETAEISPTPWILTITPTAVPPPTSIPTATSALEWVEGDMHNQIGRLETHAPRAESEGFIQPTIEEVEAFAELVEGLLAGEVEQAEKTADLHNYELLLYQDRGDEQAGSYLLRERKPIQTGWGLYVLRLNSTNHVIVEAPHPLADEGTPAIALAIYRALDARTLFVGGAHRNANQDGSADVAHNPQTIFQAFHTAFGEDAIVLQIHGFAADKHPDYPQVILGSDQSQPTPLLADFANSLESQGVQVGICDGVHWQDLCGTQNVQSAVMRTAVFIHIELNETIRSQPQPLLVALSQILP